MNIPRRPLLLSFLSLLLLFAVGCTDDEGPTDVSATDISGTHPIGEIDLDQSYGGLEYRDEPVAFGDTELLAELAHLGEIGEEDSLAGEDAGLRGDDVRRTWVRILWGRLDGRPEDVLGGAVPDRLVDWTGTISVSEGAVALSRIIRFESPWDHRLPRSDRQRLGWVSHTGPHFDGILVCVLSRTDSTGEASGELTFRTGPLTETFDIAELDGLDERIAVDEDGNAVSFTARVAPPRPDCASGFLAGFWRAVPDIHTSPGGFFRGLVLSERGVAVGFLKGRWGMNSAGDRVFAGKLIGRTGHIRGLVQGTWDSSAEGSDTGRFQGHWAARSGERLGQLRGLFESRGDGGLGFFSGQWLEDCDVAE